MKERDLVVPKSWQAPENIKQYLIELFEKRDKDQGGFLDEDEAYKALTRDLGTPYTSPLCIKNNGRCI